MLQTRRDLDFTREAIRRHRITQVDVEQLDGDRPAMLDVQRAIDLGHAAATDEAFHDVFAAARGPEAFDLIVHE